MNENEIKCKQFLEEFVNQYINWEEGKCLVPTQANVNYSIKLYKKSGKPKLFVVYNGVRRSKIIKTI
jgi:hypothetical protein